LTECIILDQKSTSKDKLSTIRDILISEYKKQFKVKVY
jgi:hypothetical protein